MVHRAVEVLQRWFLNRQHPVKVALKKVLEQSKLDARVAALGLISPGSFGSNLYTKHHTVPVVNMLLEVLFIGAAKAVLGHFR